MVTNKKFTLPHPNNSTLKFQKKNHHSSTPSLPPKKTQFSQKSTPLSLKKKPPKAPQSGNIS